MAKVIKIKIVGADSNGVSGQKVRMQGATQTLVTNPDGLVTFLIAQAETAIFLNDKQVWAGPLAELNDVVTYTVDGQPA